MLPLTVKASGVLRPRLAQPMHHHSWPARYSPQQLSRRLSKAIDSDTIVPYFQPLVDLHSERISSFEVLARWHDQQLGTIPPEVFIPLAEREGLLDTLCLGLVARACEQAASWPGDFKLSVNVTPPQLQRAKLTGQLIDRVIDSGFPISRLQVEITETALFSDMSIALEEIERLKCLGVGLVLDDFGAGVAGLHRLQSFPFDTLKIDANFVRSLDSRRASRKIVSAIIGLGHSLGMRIVAEGVEEHTQAACLIALGCDLGQGWLFGRPQPATETLRLLMERGISPVPQKPARQHHRLMELRTLYARLPMALGFYDATLGHVDSNALFQREMPHASRLDERRLDQLLPPPMDQACHQWHQQLRQGDDTAFGCSLDASGTSRLDAHPVRDEDGVLIGVSVIIARH